MVDALVPPAQQAETVACSEFSSHRLVESTATGAEQQQRSGRLHGFDRLEDRLGPHHHAGSPTERRIVDRAVHVGGLLPDVVAAQVEQALTTGLAEQALRAEVVDESREQREDVDPQHLAGRRWFPEARAGGTSHQESRSKRPSGVSTWIVSASIDTTKFDGTSAPVSSSRRSAAGLASTETHTAPVGAVGVDDTAADHLVHPERVGIVDRATSKDPVRVALGRRAVGDLRELHDPATVGGDA